MNRETIHEEFYGASMESEIVGQEFLAEAISIGGIVLMSWGIYKFFKDGIKEVKDRIQKRKDEEDERRKLSVAKTTDKNYLEFSSIEEYSEFLDRFIKAVKNSQSKVKGSESKYYAINLFAELMGIKFVIKPEPYLSKSEMLERFKSLMRRDWAGEDEVYETYMYLNIHPSSIRQGITWYEDEVIFNNSTSVNLIKKDNRYGLTLTRGKRSITLMYEDNLKFTKGYRSDIKTEVARRVNECIDVLKGNGSDEVKKKAIFNFLCDFIWEVVIDAGGLDTEVIQHVIDELGVKLIPDCKEADLNDYEYLEQCFLTIEYTGPKTK